MIRPVFLSMVLPLGALGALAQDRETSLPLGLDIEQVENIQDVQPIAQIAPSRSKMATQADSGSRADLSPRQAGSAENGLNPPAQLASEPASANGSTQLAPAGRTAQASTPLSDTGQSAPGAVARLEGNDRCDPRSDSADRIALCERVIEQRSEEFARQRATLSPEQRLLADQSGRENLIDDKGALIRRIGRNGDADEREAQEIASLVFPGVPLNEPAPTKELPVDSEAAALAELIAAIGNAAGAPPPQQ